MDSLLELISPSGVNLMSLSLCLFWLKCYSTASVVLFCMALRCSPNLSRSALFVCPMNSAGAFGVLLYLRHWIMWMWFFDAHGLSA